MPLSPGSSRQVISRNISEMVHSGYPQRQAVAASLSNARRHPSGRQDGGATEEGAPQQPQQRSAGFNPAGSHLFGPLRYLPRALPQRQMPKPLAPRAVETSVKSQMGEQRLDEPKSYAEGGDLTPLPMPQGIQSGGRTTGIVDHDNDPDLPPVRDDVRMIPMLPTPRGYQDPAYLQTIQRIVEGQRRLNAMHPIQREMLRRYYLGGMLYHLGGYVY